MSEERSTRIDAVTNPLSLERDLHRVVAARLGDPSYSRLRSVAGSIFHDRRCIVVGSAPRFVAPDLRPEDLVVTVNGSGSQLSKLGVSAADVTLLNGTMFSPVLERMGFHDITEVSKATIGVLRNARTRHCFISTNSYSFSDSTKGLSEINFTSDHLHEMTGLHRAAIVGDVCGVELGFGGLEERVSTGVAAICLALWGGAGEVIFAGFSMEGGHCYIPSKTPRLHSIGDREFFRLCSTGKLRVSTTDARLREQFGIPGGGSA